MAGRSSTLGTKGNAMTDVSPPMLPPHLDCLRQAFLALPSHHHFRQSESRSLLHRTKREQEKHLKRKPEANEHAWGFKKIFTFVESLFVRSNFFLLCAQGVYIKPMNSCRAYHSKHIQARLRLQERSRQVWLKPAATVGRLISTDVCVNQTSERWRAMRMAWARQAVLQDF